MSLIEAALLLCLLLPAAVVLAQDAKSDEPAADAPMAETPMKQVEDSITGKSQVVAHGTIDMPVWGQRFEELRPDWKLNRRKALARQRIYNLALYIESIQAK